MRSTVCYHSSCELLVASCQPGRSPRATENRQPRTDHRELATENGQLMRWDDRVYGSVAIEEPAILDLIGCPTFQRLKGVRQAGPSALAFPFKNVTPLRAQPGGLRPAAPAGCRPSGAGRRPAPRHLAHGVLARGGLHHRLPRAGPSRAPQAADARSARHRRGARAAGLCAGRVLRRFHLPPARAAAALAVRRPAGLLPPRRHGLRRGHPGGRRPHPRPPGRARRPHRPDRRRRGPRGRPPLRRHEPRLVGQRHRGLHLQRVRRRPPRGA